MKESVQAYMVQRKTFALGGPFVLSITLIFRRLVRKKVPQIVNPQMCDKPATFYMSQTETATLYTGQQNQEQLTVMHITKLVLYMHQTARTSDHLHRTKQNLEHLEHINLTETATFDKHRSSDP
jgi:hypothetical protein